MRLLLTGANGLVGREVARAATERGYSVEGWALTADHEQENYVDFHAGDLTRGGVPENAVRESRPDLIVHAAALTDVDALEGNPAAAQRTNVALTTRLAEVAYERRIRFVYVSTEGVYGGPGPHREDEAARPANVYARTKLAGETWATRADPEALILRVSVFGWTLRSQPPKLAERIVLALEAGEPVALWADQYFSPLHARYLADAILDLAATRYVGTLNVGARDAVTQAGLGELIAERFGFPSPRIVRASLAGVKLPAARPLDVSLDVSLAEWTRDRALPTVREGVDLLYDEWRQGRAPRQQTVLA